MKLTVYTAPFDCQRMLSLWADTFGQPEAELERPQVDGTEASFATDTVLAAEENGVLLGTLHATVPKDCPTLAGLGGMCTTPAARGKGLGKLLFGTMLEMLDSQGVTATFLGTSNPIAAKLYGSFGFSYLPGSNVMARYAQGDTVDFTRSCYGADPGHIDIRPGSPAMRIPLIPLVLHRGAYQLLDCNTGLVSSRLMTQLSCMGLYPKYMTLMKEGGSVYGAYSETGILGAVSSFLPTDKGLRADLFCCQSFERAIPGLLEAHPEAYLLLADMDEEKLTLAQRLGYRPAEREALSLRGMTIPCTVYRK